jgi:glycosyltransferase involved in cell wall biosynthesis
MKIMHIIGTLDPDAGGPPMVATRLAAAQGAAGHDVTIVHAAPHLTEQAIISLTNGVPGFRNVLVRSVDPGTGLDKLTARPARRALAQLITKDHFVHLHGIWEPVLRAGGLVADDIGAPYTVTPHGMLDPWSLRQHAFKKRLAMRLGYRRMLVHAAFIHALNNEEARLMKPLSLGRPSEVIPNGIFLDELAVTPPAGTFRTAHPQLGDAQFVLFLSRLHEKKGLDYLADAFAMVAETHPHVKLVVAGPDGGARADFISRIEQAGIRDRVLLVGPLYAADKYGAMIDATCFCLPSRQEGFSVAIIEALACGLPVVVSENCHFEEIDTAGAGRVVRLEAEAIATALRGMLTNEATRLEMSERGRRLVHENYTWPQIAQMTIAAYERAWNQR